MELADYIPAVLAGVSRPQDIQRCVCAAGHKAMYSDTWGGLPSKAFLERLDPRLADLRDRLFERAYAADRPAGRLCAGWAAALGLREGHRHRDGRLRRALRRGRRGRRHGHARQDHRHLDVRLRDGTGVGGMPNVPGICGIVDGSIMPGYYGIEAGQSAVGDLLNWWVERVCEGDEALHAGR